MAECRSHTGRPEARPGELETGVERPRVLILGAGPAGVGAAFGLGGTGAFRVTVVEQKRVVGGNAGSFELEGQRVDYGSHRLHPACDSRILSEIRGFLGEDLLWRPRHGRIRLRGRWVHFPLKPVDLLLHLDPRFTLGTARDMVRRMLPGTPEGGSTFASVLEASLGTTICRDFYFPYARKIWGREPEELSATQARRRVAANSFGKLIRKVLGHLPGVRPVGFDHFYYPRGGFGAISEAYARAARERGVEFRLGWRADRLEHPESPGAPFRVVIRRGDEAQTLEADRIWSTLPISAFARISSPRPPASVLEAAQRIEYRSMLLVYLTLEVDRFSEFDAHYFPGPEARITRLSECKNYSSSSRPAGRTTLCAELPCASEGAPWEMSDEELGALVQGDLSNAGIPVDGLVRAIHVRRLRFAYPIYHRDYERPFRALDEWVGGLPGVLSFGRQGLFAHDNTHHALFMARCAVECLDPSGFHADRWEAYRRIFETHVVED
ncbi:MAG: protoporphyrinogen/coproporphyrinogen oxidase [Gemmatimonadota bacterium]